MVGFLCTSAIISFVFSVGLYMTYRESEQAHSYFGNDEDNLLTLAVILFVAALVLGYCGVNQDNYNRAQAGDIQAQRTDCSNKVDAYYYNCLENRYPDHPDLPSNYSRGDE